MKPPPHRSLEQIRQDRLAEEKLRAPDPVDHPPHYTGHPSGVECITIAEAYNFNVGNAMKYLWRAGLKSASPIEDLKKAAWYIHREIQRLDTKKP